MRRMKGEDGVGWDGVGWDDNPRVAVLLLLWF